MKKLMLKAIFFWMLQFLIFIVTGSNCVIFAHDTDTSVAVEKKINYEALNFATANDHASNGRILLNMGNDECASNILRVHDRACLILQIDDSLLSEASGMRIEVTGENKIEARNYLGITSKEIEITKEGESIVKAWAIDEQGNILNKTIEIIVNLDNTKPDISDLSLEITKGESPLQNGWYNSNEVEVTITSNIDESQKQNCKTIYGTRVKGNTEEIKNLKVLNGKSEVIKVEEEGVTEVVAYRESLSGVKSDIKTIDVKIDRTPPKVGDLMCKKTKDNKVEMNLTDVQDEYGMNKYIFYTNNTKNEQVITDSQKPETTISEIKPSSLVTVIAMDNAGNYMANSSPYAETEYPAIYDYLVYDTESSNGYFQQIIIDEEINAYLTIRNYSNLANYFNGVRNLNANQSYICMRF